MLRRARYRALQFVFDMLALAAAWRLAVEVRLWLNPVWGRAFTRAELLELIPPFSVLALLWVLVATYLNAYRPHNSYSAASSIAAVAESASAMAALVIVVGFVSQSLGAEVSRSLVLVLAPLGFVAILASRYAALVGSMVAAERFPAPERVAIVGNARAGLRVAKHLKEGNERSINVAGVISSSFDAQERSGETPVLGAVEHLAVLINRHRLDRLILIDDALLEAEREQCAQIAKQMHVTVSRSLARLDLGQTPHLTHLGGYLMLDMHPRSFPRVQHFIKRAVDVAVSGGLLTLLSPLLAVLAICIKATSEGPVLYRAPRVGKGGRYFTFLKFRSMRQADPARHEVAEQNEHTGHVFKIRADPRVTSIGRFMRRYSLDELPQLWNVLRGDMSLVGPRPLPAQDLEPDGQSREFREWSEARSSVPPGISGLWQISGRSDLPFEKWIELDLTYVRNWSLKLDARILLETPLAVIAGKGAY
ncbi:MAG: sugar transferase [Acidobacteria bacterium]|nr:sugar transferase [Acidobacteriota bacterium]